MNLKFNNYNVNKTSNFKKGLKPKPKIQKNSMIKLILKKSRQRVKEAHLQVPVVKRGHGLRRKNKEALPPFPTLFI